jgi:adenosylhomocysteinase
MDSELIQRGLSRIAWAKRHMPVLSLIEQRWEKEKPLLGLRVGACLHVTTETANLMLVLKAGGAEVALCASNPLSTQDDVAAALNAEYGIPTFAVRGEDQSAYYRHIHQVLDFRPQITMDDGADLITTLHTQRPELLPEVIAGTEETTTGVIRLKAMAKARVLGFPVVAVNDALTKHMFDNRYGTGQSAVDGIVRATNYLLAGSTFVVVGYGWCGKGVAARARGLGAQVIVVETDPIRALEAIMDGYRVTNMSEAAAIGDIFCTVTGNRHVIDAPHFERMKDGAILANAGHFDVEINLPALRALAVAQRRVRQEVEEFELPDGRRLYLLAEGRLVNLAAAEGHPAQVMDMSFANQALTVEWLYRGGTNGLEKKVYRVPTEIDRQVAELKLASLGIKIERLTPQQEEYLRSWQAGT